MPEQISTLLESETMTTSSLQYRKFAILNSVQMSY